MKHNPLEMMGVGFALFGFVIGVLHATNEAMFWLTVACGLGTFFWVILYALVGFTTLRIEGDGMARMFGIFPGFIMFGLAWVVVVTIGIVYVLRGDTEWQFILCLVVTLTVLTRLMHAYRSPVKDTLNALLRRV